MTNPDTELQRKRLKTLTKRYTPEQRKEWASKAGKASPTKFTSDAARRANDIRWAAVRAAKEAKQKHDENKDLKEA